MQERINLQGRMFLGKICRSGKISDKIVLFANVTWGTRSPTPQLTETWGCDQDGALHAPIGSKLVIKQAIVHHAIRSLTIDSEANTGGAAHAVINLHHIRGPLWRSSIISKRPTSGGRLTELCQGTAACRPELDDTLQYELI